MPNNMARHLFGYQPVAGGERKIKRREQTSIVRSNSKLLSAIDLGSINGGPSAVAVIPVQNDPYADPLNRQGVQPGP